MNIAIPYKIYEQIQFFVDKSDVECSGLGKVVITPNGYTVTEICLLTQENTGTHTEIDSQAVTKAMYDLRASQGGIYFWWHSHVNMGVFWSGTDTKTIEEIGQNGLCVAVVFNKKKEMKGAVWLKGSELSPNLYFSDVTVKIDHDGASEETRALWAADFDSKCKTKHFSAYEGVSPLYLASQQALHDNFDLTEFENKLSADERQQLAFLSAEIMDGISVSMIDNALAKCLEIIKGSKTNKHDRKKAYKEYKEMALDQKNYLADVDARMGGAMNGGFYGAQ